MDAPTLLARIDVMISALTQELTPEDRHGGWTAQAQTAMRGYYERMRAHLAERDNMYGDPQYRGVVRGLDSWGISEGPIFHEAIAIEAALRSGSPSR
jgi:hypothetical protein